jgi:DNA-binding MarR family transcriptional regulator
MALSGLDEAPRPVGAIARELAESNAYLLSSLGIGCKALAIARAEDNGFELFDYTVLAVLSEGERATQATIAELLMVDPSRLVALLDSLEDRGLIARHRDPQDRRRHVVAITAHGVNELERMRHVVNAMELEFLAPLTPAEQATLHVLLVKLAAQNDPRCCPLNPDVVAQLAADLRAT